jgi:aarF domain-containing kinase
MQTDPNWSNFLYNELTGKLELIDFGATREYSKEFMDDFLRMLRAAISGDRSECVHWSEKIGYLTGEEKETMRNAHVDSMIALAEPFKPTAPDPYPFAGQTITDRVRAQVPLMLRERLTPPPEPTYSLNRKLSGAFLLCARLKANVSCRGLFEEVTSSHALGQQWKATPFSAPDGIRRVHTRRSRKLSSTD